MKIVIVVDLVDNITNGSVMTARRFTEGLRARGHEVRVVAIGADGETDCPLKEKYIPLLTEVSALNEIKFAKFDKKKITKTFEGADIIHFIFHFPRQKNPPWVQIIQILHYIRLFCKFIIEFDLKLPKVKPINFSLFFFYP